MGNLWTLSRMELKPTGVNPLKEFLHTLPLDAPVPLSKNNLSCMAKIFNKGGVYCETFDDMLKVLDILADQRLVELKNNYLRITEYGKVAL